MHQSIRGLTKPVTYQLSGTYSDKCNETAALGNAMDVESITKIVALIGPACSDDVQVRLIADLTTSKVWFTRFSF